MILNLINLTLPQTANDWQLVIASSVLTTFILGFFFIFKFFNFIKERQLINDQYIVKMSEQYEKTTENT